MTSLATEPYLEAIRGTSYRVLSLLDRDEFSPTFGCMDRTFWAWKFTDFPGARFQEGLCALSFLYSTQFDGNQVYRRENLLHWIAGGFNFWMKIQRSQGDFDEAYPLEHSLAATAFSTFYLAEAYRFLADDLPAETGTRFRGAIGRAGAWLIKSDETHGFLSNHLAAAAAALYHAYQITGEERFEERSRYFLQKILDHQSVEGWYEEYGGADPGYQTHGSFYLARYAELSGDGQVFESLDRSFEFLAQFIHPDLSIGGEYTSRNTQTYYPAAFEMMSSRSASASWIARQMRPSVQTLAAAGLGTVDIYNFFPLLNNYVFSYLGALNADSALPTALPDDSTSVRYFAEAGFVKVSRPSYELFVGARKGGMLKLFDRRSGRLAFSSSGYIGRLTTGGVFSNQAFDEDRNVDIGSDKIAVDGSFYQVSRPVMSPWRFLAFRGFSLTLGHIPRAAYWLKALLVRVLIYKKRAMDLRFTREILLHDDGIELHDHLKGGVGDHIARLVHGENFTTIHMGSSRYFVPNELVDFVPGQAEFDAPIDPGTLAAGVSRSFRVRLKRLG